MFCFAAMVGRAVSRTIRWLTITLFLTQLVLGQNAGFDSLAKRAAEAREQNHEEEARSLYKQALRLKPDWSEGWWYLGSLYYDQDHYAEGAAAFRHLTELEPKMAAGWAMLGLCEYETRDYERALAHLERGDQLGVPQDSPVYNVARYHLALLLTRNERYDAAIQIVFAYAAHETAGPKWAEAMGIAALHKPVLPNELPATERELVMSVGRAMCDAAARHGTEAISEMEMLIQQHPAQPQLHYLYGQLLLSSDPDKALEQFKEELKIVPGHPEALISIASEYLKRDDYKDALPYAEKAVITNPQYFPAHAVLGRVLVEGGIDVPRGLHELETAVRIAPGNPQARFALATAYAKVGRKADAARERAEFLRLRAQAPAEH